MPVMKPSASARNFTPSSRDAFSPESETVGAFASFQMEHGQVEDEGGACAVVNVQVTLAGKAVPERSLTRGSVVPPRTNAVYVVSGASAELGCEVAVNVLLL
jgi:hypothetical protein